MARLQHQCRVIEQKKVCPQFYRLRLEAGPWATKIRPGQFIHIRVSQGLDPFLRRPFSVHRSIGKSVEILYSVVGPGTQILSQKKKNDVLDVQGPLGNSFSLPPAGVKYVVMIAGGVGVAPFLMLADVLKRKPVELILLYGGRSQDQVFSLNEFKHNGCQVHVATNDGSAGKRGHVSELFNQIPRNPKKTFLYACGPHPMMVAVQQFAFAQGLAGQVSCEERMACGLGACLGCVVKTKTGYKTACYDGPVFDLREVIF